MIETKPDEPSTFVICETNLHKDSSVQEEILSEFKCDFFNCNKTFEKDWLLNWHLTTDHLMKYKYKNRSSIEHFKENVSERPENRTISNYMVSKSNQDQRVYRNENGVCIVNFAKKVVNESQKLSDLNLDGKFMIYKSEDDVENMSESEMKDPLLM